MERSSRRLIPAALLLLPGALGVFAAEREAGAGATAAVAVGFGAVLVLRATVGSNLEERRRIRSLADFALPFVPGLLVVFSGFNGGSFHPGTTGLLAVLLATLLGLRMALADDPLAGISLPLGIAAAGLALYAGWNLLSGSWSGAHSRALIEFDRAVMYLLALLLMGSVARTTRRTRHMVWGLAAGISIVSGAALVSRVLPDVLPTTANIANNRLSYPLGYWNGLGLLAAMGVILCFHLASSEHEPALGRVVGAAAVPALAATVLFTFSRGAIFAGGVGLAVYLIAGRPRALLQGLFATLPTAGMAVVVAYNADALATDNPTSSLAVSQGHDVALVVALCTGGAAVLRWLSLPLDGPLARLAVPRGVGVAMVVSVLSAALVVSLALGVPSALSRQYHRVVNTTTTKQTGDVRDRLTDPGNNGRIDFWRVARRAFRAEPVRGAGAGTYETYWARHRPLAIRVEDAHSLYLEVLGELGVVGLLLLAMALVPVLVALAVRSRGPTAVYAALLGAAVAWAIHAGIDWDWELPAVTLGVIAAGGAALAAPEGKRPLGDWRPGITARLLLVAAVLAVAVPAAFVALSQANLDDAVAAYDRGDCQSASSDARRVDSLVGNRPDGYEILGYCAARERRAGPALRWMDQAVARDRDTWEYRYGLAVVRGSLGLDPTLALAQSRGLNPREPVVRRLDQLIGISDRRLRTQRARRILRDPLFVR